MRRPGTVILGVVLLVAVSIAVAVGIRRAQERPIEVRVEEVAQRDLTAIITATGSVRARRQVNISSDVMGRVTELTVEEGDEVEAGQVLLRIDPSQIEATVSRATAALSQAESQVVQQQASLLQAERDLERIRRLSDTGLVTLQNLQDAETRVEIQRSQIISARHAADQARAGLEEARDQLGRTTIRAPISGRITRLNIEEGETAVVGTMNNPGSLLLTVSDLSVVEAVLTVGEIDIPRVFVGDSAHVEIDAFPGESYPARVSRIGSSSIRSRSQNPTAATTSGGTVDFEVVLTLLDRPELLRPDLSATADIVVDSRPSAVAVPIISVTVLETRSSGEGSAARRRNDAEGASGDAPGREGVFVVRDGRVEFREVELGITGREYFEVLSGLSPGDSVVSGPFRRIRELTDGAAVRVLVAPTPTGDSA